MRFSLKIKLILRVDVLFLFRRSGHVFLMTIWRHSQTLSKHRCKSIFEKRKHLSIKAQIYCNCKVISYTKTIKNMHCFCLDWKCVFRSRWASWTNVRYCEAFAMWRNVHASLFCTGVCYMSPFLRIKLSFGSIFRVVSLLVQEPSVLVSFSTGTFRLSVF